MGQRSVKRMESFLWRSKTVAKAVKRRRRCISGWPASCSQARRKKLSKQSDQGAEKVMDTKVEEASSPEEITVYPEEEIDKITIKAETEEAPKLLLMPEEGLFLSGFVASRGFPINVMSACLPGGKSRELTLTTMGGEELAKLVFPFQDPEKHYNSLIFLGLGLVTALYEKMRPMTPAPMSELEIRTMMGLVSSMLGSNAKKKHIKALRIVQQTCGAWLLGGRMSHRVPPGETAGEMSLDISGG